MRRPCGMLGLAVVIAGLAVVAAAQEEPATPAPPSPVVAAPCLRVAFVDMERLVPETDAVREALGEADEALAAVAAAIDEDTLEFERLRAEYDRQKGLMAIETGAARRAELEALAEDIDRRTQEYDREMRLRERQLEPLMALLHDTVADTARSAGIDIVLRGDSVLYGSQAADMTPQVIAALEARGPRIRELLKAPPALVPAVSPDDTPTTAPLAPPAAETGTESHRDE